MASSAPNGRNGNEVTTTTTVKRTAAALGPADDLALPPPVKRRRLTSAPLPPPPPPPPSAVKAASSRLAAAPPSPSAGKTTAPRARATWGTPSSMKAAWLASRSPTRSVGTRLLFRGIGTPAGASSSAKAASRASRSAKKIASPAVGGAPRTAATSKHQREAAKSRRRLRDGRISLLEIEKPEATQGRDAAATRAASQLQEASMYDSVLKNKRQFTEICESAEVSNPLPTIDPFLGVYQDTVKWKDVAESSVGLSARYWVVGGDPIIHHELSLPHSTSSQLRSPNTAEVAVKLCSVMRRWFLDFVDDALVADATWKHRNKERTLESLNEVNGWLERQIAEEWKNKIKRLKRRISDELRRSQEYWRPARNGSRGSRW